MQKKNILIALIILLVVAMSWYWLNRSGSTMDSLSNANPVGNWPPGGEPGGTKLSEDEKAQCGITAEVTEGPYYVSGMPQLKDGNLNSTQLPGSPLKVSGYVYEGTDASKPIPNAIVDIWQADNDGKYHPNSNGDSSKYSTDQLALRGYVMTDALGKYEFTTVYPGEYSGRTRHIHIKIRAHGFDELTTQLIVPSLAGDDISFDEDTVSQGLPDCHLLTINSSSTPDSSVFDFRLQK